VWQFSDKYSWVPNSFKGKGDALLWSSDYATKPAYDAVIKVLKAASATPANGTTTDGDKKSAAGQVSVGAVSAFLGAALSAWALL